MTIWRIDGTNTFCWATHRNRDESHLPLSGTRRVRDAWFWHYGTKSRCVRGSTIKRCWARGRDNAWLRTTRWELAWRWWCNLELAPTDFLASASSGSLKCCAGCFQSLPPRWRFRYWFQVGLEHTNGCAHRGQSARGNKFNARYRRFSSFPS